MESSMSMLEAGLRGGIAAILVLGAVLLLRDLRRSPAARNCALFLLSAVGYVACSAPGLARLDTPVGFLLLVVSLGLPALFWTSAAAIFDDDFKPSWQGVLAWIGLVVVGLWSILGRQPLVDF